MTQMFGKTIAVLTLTTCLGAISISPSLASGRSTIGTGAELTRMPAPQTAGPTWRKPCSHPQRLPR